MANWIHELLGKEADGLLDHRCRTIAKEQLHLPGPDFIDRIFVPSDRNLRVLGNLSRLFHSGRLADTGYLSILPVDQGVEHSAGASFAVNPTYFDAESIVRLAIEGGCNAVASTFGVLGAVARKYAHRIPFIVKITHNELLTYPNKYDQIMFGTVDRAIDMGSCRDRRHCLFWFRRIRTADYRGEPGFCQSARIRAGNHPMVLSAQQSV